MKKNEIIEIKIPKKIHYCWFGGNPLPKSAISCIESWKKYCPDYEIIEWNETNVDLKNSEFLIDALKAKKWAFVSDALRYKILYENGGIYLDVDVEIIKSFDNLLVYDSFMGFEGDEYINSGLGFGASKGCKIIKEMAEIYDSLKFPKNLDNLVKISTPILITNLLEKKGLKKNGEFQIICEMTLFPQEYFCPKSPFTRMLNITKNTYSIHHFDASWVEKNEKENIYKLEKHAQELMITQCDLVSIIIPVYNGANFLSKAINSALSQTYRNIEVIVINDGSDDNGETDSICKSYGNRIRYFSKENGGVSTALNLGIQKMKGKYFSWLSHDDMYFPEKIEKQVKFLKRQNENTVVVSNWVIIDNSDNILDKKYINKKIEKDVAAFLAFDRKTWLNGCSLLIPKKIIDDNGFFNEELKSTQDYDFFFRMSKKGVRFKVLENHLLYSRAHKDQGCLNIPTALKDSDLIHCKIMNSLEKDRILKYFDYNLQNIMETYSSFKNNSYKITSAYLLNVIILYHIEKNNTMEVNKVYKDNVIGLINNDASSIDFIKQIAKRKNKKRLLFCSGAWLTGGVERVLSIIFEGLIKDFEIFLLTPFSEQKSSISLPKNVIHIIVSEEQFENNFDSVIILSLIHI